MAPLLSMPIRHLGLLFQASHWSIRDIYIIHTDLSFFVAGCPYKKRLPVGHRIWGSNWQSPTFLQPPTFLLRGAPVPQMHPGPLNIRKASVNFRLCNSGNIFEFVYCCAKFVLVEADSTHNYWEANFTTQIGVQHNSTTLGNKQTNAELWVYALRTTAAVQQMHGQITFQFQILYSALTL